MPSPEQPPPRVQIERVSPLVDCGRHAPKRPIGETVDVTADVFRDGRAVLRAVLRPRAPSGGPWVETPMAKLDGGDSGWAGSFTVTECGDWQFAIEAWSDPFASWCDELGRKVAAGQEDLAGELSE